MRYSGTPCIKNVVQAYECYSQLYTAILLSIKALFEKFSIVVNKYTTILVLA